MGSRVGRYVAGLALLVWLSGCAGYHSMPPSNYSAVAAEADQGDRVVRVVFDQNGNIYPPSPNTLGLPNPPQARRGNRAFDVRSWYKDRGLAYDPDAIHSDFASQIERMLAAAPTRRLVFLIKGFNNSYQESDDEFRKVRSWLRARGGTKDLAFVQVYWDSLFKGPGTAPEPLAYFGEAMTYSNFAGMCGLRELLGGIRTDVPVTYLTHSRGAAVALASITDPLFDPRIKIPCNALPLRPGKLKDGVLVAFAPAVGDGHMREADGRIDLDMYSNLQMIYVGFNPNDEATSKTALGLRIGGYRGGDTRLGSGDAYFRLIAAGHDGRLQREHFHQKEHDWLSYLANESPSQCLFWAGRLIERQPGNCAVSRGPQVQP